MQGYDVEDGLDAAGLEVTGIDYFQVPVCNDDDNDDVWLC